MAKPDIARHAEMTSAELLALYDHLLHQSRQMLAAAMQGCWEDLLDLTNARTPVVELLRQQDIIPWPADAGVMKSELIRAVLSIDAEIQVVTEKWISRLTGSVTQVPPQ